MTDSPSDVPDGAPETAEGEKPSRRFMAFLPFLIFGGIAIAFFFALRAGGPSTLPSALVGKPVPEFSLPALEGLKREDGTTSPGFDSADLASGEVTVVNVYASWCGPCRVEHPFLMELSKRPGVRIFGINYKDKPENGRRFLTTLGNPYTAVGTDQLGRTSINWGVYGIPETFVVDGKGIIRFKTVGPLSPRIVAEKLIPAIEAAARDGS